MEKITKEQAIKYYEEKKGEEVRTIQEVIRLDKPGKSFFIINDNYIVGYMTPQAKNVFMRNQHFKTRINGYKTTKKDIRNMLAYNENLCAGEYERRF